MLLVVEARVFGEGVLQERLLIGVLGIGRRTEIEGAGTPDGVAMRLERTRYVLGRPHAEAVEPPVPKEAGLAPAAVPVAHAMAGAIALAAAALTVAVAHAVAVLVHIAAA